MILGPVHTWPALAAEQRRLVEGWLPGAVVEADLSWGLVETTVLQVRHGGGLVVVKAGGPQDHHIAREVEAHRRWLQPWASAGRAPALLHADEGARVVVTRWLPGDLAQGTPAATDPDVHRQAGELLAQLHQQEAVHDAGFEAAANTKTRRWLAGPHAIPVETARRLAEEVGSWPEHPAVLVPTHGDFHPRNWVVDDGRTTSRVGVIDFGRAALRPAESDLVRLVQRDWVGRPDLEAAFLTGYGSDPREDGSWRRTRVREAVGTACWAHLVGDAAFEQEGLRLLEELTA